MSEKALIAALIKIKALAEEALGSAGSERGQRAARASRASVATAAAPETLPEHILKLRDSGFFKEARIASDVHSKLQASYHCELNRVVTALGRLMNSRKLRKATKVVGKKKLVAYVW
jgi:hypothetical protein